MNTWGTSWGTSWLDSWGASGAPAVAVVQQESLIGGKKAKKRQPWPTFDDDEYDEIKPKVVKISNIVKPKDDITPQIKLAVAQRQSLVAEIARLRKVKQLTIVGIAKIAELRHSRSLIDAEIERLRKLKRIRQDLALMEQEEADIRAIAFIVSDLYH